MTIESFCAVRVRFAVPSTVPPIVTAFALASDFLIVTGWPDPTAGDGSVTVIAPAVASQTSIPSFFCIVVAAVTFRITYDVIDAAIRESSVFRNSGS